MIIEKRFNELVAQVLKVQGSDLYILPHAGEYRITMISQQRLQEITRISIEEGRKLIRYIKYQSGMDLSETRRPQLSRMVYQLGGQKYHCRISGVGNFLNQESLVIRFLYQLTDLNLQWESEKPLQRLMQTLRNTSGMLLLSGKMGAGKTTTLHYLLQDVKRTRLILSIEDPVELADTEILQLQVNEIADMTYPKLLKIALRLHPEILLIGEIRDAKTAQIAIEAAMSGHLVLSTVHARSCLGVWYRMRAFGVDESDLAYALNMVGYQEMVQTVDKGACGRLEVLDGYELQEKLKEKQRA